MDRLDRERQQACLSGHESKVIRPAEDLEQAGRTREVKESRWKVPETKRRFIGNLRSIDAENLSFFRHFVKHDR
jgi:hypothetical protein